MKIHFLDNNPSLSADAFLFFPWHFAHINGFSIFNDNVCFFDFREMVFKNIGGIVDTDRDDGAAAFFCDFKAALMERQCKYFIHVCSRGICCISFLAI